MADTSTGSATPASEAPAPSLTPDQATAHLEKMLGLPAEEEKDKAVDPSPEPAAGEPEEPPAEEPPVEDAEAADEDNAEVEGQEVLFSVKIDGKDVPVPVSEARDGYLRRTDYTQKTQALAQERQAFAAQIQHAQQMEQVYGALIPVLEEQIKAQMPQEPDWAQLEAHPDKSFYWTARARWDETQRRLGAIAEEKDRLSELQNMEVNQKLNEHLDRSRTWLVEQLPEWRDEQRATKDKAALRDYALQNGFTQYDIDHAYDARLIVMVYKSMLYDGLVKNRPKPSTGEAPSPLKPGVAIHQPATIQAKLTKAKNRLRQTGRPDDATAAIELILQRGH